MIELKSVNLDDVCDILDNQRVPITSSDRKPGPYPYYGANGIQDYVDSYLFDDELVLLAEDGGNFGSKEKAIAYRVSGKCWVNNHAHILKPKPGIIDVDYLCYSIMFYDVSKLITGTTRSKLTQAQMRQMKIPLPPLEEQKKIAATLDAVSDLIQLRKRQMEELDLLVKARFLEMFEGKALGVVEFGDVCLFLRNGASIKQTSGAGGYPITRIETLSNDIFNVDRLGYADIMDLEKFRKYLLEKGDILISHINSVTYLGRAVQYKGQLKKPIIHGMNLLCARIVDRFNPTYIEWLFKTSVVKRYISSITKKAVNQASINTADLKRMLIPSPTIALQNEFASLVEQVDKFKGAIQKSLTELDILMGALMNQNFGQG